LSYQRLFLDALALQLLTKVLKVSNGQLKKYIDQNGKN